jgi:S-DNA-T family DNA segregation ATPase FtsK/SpoIIIE
MKNKLIDFFDKFRLNVSIIENNGSYGIVPEPPTRIKDIKSLKDDLALFLGVKSIMLNNNENFISLEIRNISNKTLLLDNYKHITAKQESVICLGRGDNNYIFYNPKSDYHMLIGGTSGFGKSTLIKSIIEQFLLKLNTSIDLVDTKRIDFKEINSNNFNLYSDDFDIISLIKYHNKRIDDIFLTGKIPTKLSLLIIDEFADLMSSPYSKIIKEDLLKLIQRSRAANTFCILATQRPSAKIIDGSIKANIQTRISLKTSSKIDSRIILDSAGAENIQYKGECIIKSDKYDFQQFKSFYV